jgi:hypothetical protein
MRNTQDSETSAVALRGGDWHPDERDAESVDEAAHNSNLGRSILYRALNPDPDKRDGLPFLPSLKVGKRRLILRETRRAWLRQLEQLESGGAKSAAVFLAFLIVFTLFA